MIGGVAPGSASAGPQREVIRVKPAVAFLLAVGLIAPTAIFKGSNLLLLLLAGVLVMGILSLIMSWLGVRTLEVKRMAPRWGEVGKPIRLRYRVRRRGRILPSFGVRVQDLLPPDAVKVLRDAWVLHVGPREEVLADSTILPLRRGRLKLSDVRASSSFPFGLMRRGKRSRETHDLVVYPQRHALKSEVIRATISDRLDGPRSGRQRGDGREWYGVRPSTGRDSLRDIAWKLSAHRDELICLDRAIRASGRMRIVLDLRIPTASLNVPDGDSAREAEERAIELAASLIQAAHNDGREVGLVVPGLVSDETPIRRGARHMHRLMTRLADLNLDAHRSEWNAVGQLDRAASIVVQPDRVRPIGGRGDALYLTSRQFESLCATSEEGAEV